MAYLCSMQEAQAQTVPIETYRVLEAAHEEAQALIVELQARLGWFERQIFGAKSERFVPDAPGQLSLDFGQGPAAEQTAGAVKQMVAAHQRAVPEKKEQERPGREAIPPHLPRVEEVMEPEGSLEGMKRIGEDITEVLEYEAGRLWVRRIVRPRYVRTEAAWAQAEAAAEARGEAPPPQVAQAPAPDAPFPRFKAGASLIAAILLDKFADHLPLYRISGRFARQGLKIPDSTLAQWAAAGADHLLPLYKVLEKLFFSATYLQMDETTLKVLEEALKKCHLGYLWAAFDPVRKLPFFFYHKGRDHTKAAELLKTFAGVLQCDGYSVYETLDKKLSGVTLLNCMAHIRREFFEARANNAPVADTALTLIKVLYKIEEKARNLQLTPEERLELRQKEAKPVFETLGQWLQAQYESLNPASRIAKAVAYALRRWPNMARYLEDGRLEIDNNLTENIIRPAAIGRKNYLFAGTHESAQRIAMVYTFFAACKQHGVNPEEWLKDVLGRLHRHPVNRLEELLPHRWAPPATKQPAA